MQGHAKKVPDLAWRNETASFVKLERPVKRQGYIEADSLAVSSSEMCLCVCQQSSRNTCALRSWKDRHSANVAFFRVEDTTGNRADNLSGFLRCYEYGHLLQASLDCFWREYGVDKRSGSVAIAIYLECCREA